MTEHGVTLEVFYDGAWHPAVTLQRAPVEFMRGSETGDNDTEPAGTTLVLDDPAGMWAPKSAASPLVGKIGLNTPGRLVVDGTVQLAGELADWVPESPIRGSSWTTVQLGGVLRRLGRGRDPIRPALERASLAAGPVDYWPLGDGKTATSGANSQPGGAPATVPPGLTAPTFNGFDGALVPAGLATLPTFGAGAVLSATVRATSTTSWRMEMVYAAQDTLPAGASVRVLRWTTGGGITTWELNLNESLGDRSLSVRGTSPYLAGSPFGQTVRSTGLGDPTPLDGRVHHVAMDVEQVTANNMNYSIYFDGVLETSGTNTTGALIGRPQVGAPVDWSANPDGSSVVLTVGSIGFWSPHPATPVAYAAVGGYAGELAGSRFLRWCGELGVTGFVDGGTAETVAMGPQTTAAALDQLDEIARTDDARIFETRDDASALTMRTGASLLNQTPALTLHRTAGIIPPLRPVYSDRGTRNDVTAKAPDGSSGRAVQDDGPRNVLDPTVDPEGVGRYSTGWEVNPADGSALLDAAGWRVNLGTWDATWYASVTVSLDGPYAALVAAVDAVDIGDVVRLAGLPAAESTGDVDLLVVGIGGHLPPKTREHTFYCVPAGPYRVGILAIPAGDTDPLVGYTDSDGATVAAAVAAGAATFTVAIPSGPLWSTDPDDFPQDVLVGVQRVTVSGVAGGASPQTFTVATTPGARTIAYPVPAGAPVYPYQPLIPTL